MKHRNSVLGFIAAVSLTLRDGDAAHAQGQGITQEVQTYAGDRTFSAGWGGAASIGAAPRSGRAEVREPVLST